MNLLEQLAQQYGTDKQESCHGYTKYYYRHLVPIMNYPRTILEFGVHKGASLMMWHDFFNQSIIYGVDDGSSGDLKTLYPSHPRIRFMYGVQNDEVFLAKLLKEQPKFDVIIDDGSHYSQDITYTFRKMFDAVNSGGYYIIEDLHCSYPPYTVGDLAQRFNRNNFTATQFISTLVDYMHTNDSQFESITTYKGITFIKRN